ncbi:MAG: hypothetical protein ABI538_10240 [Pseudoxanthomonas sp.]
MIDFRQPGRKRWIALLALTLLAATGLLFWQQVRLQNRLADYRLETARSVQRLAEQQLGKDLDTRAELIAGNQAFIGYVSQAMGGILPGTVVDNASILDLLEERRAQLGLTIAAVINGQGQLVASRDGISERIDFAREPLFTDAVTTNATTHGIWFNEHRLFYVSILPLSRYGSDAGFLLAGMPVDQELAKLLSQTAGTQIALYANTAKGPEIAASTLPPAQTTELLARMSRLPAADEGDYTAQLDGTVYRGYSAPLFGSGLVRATALVPTRFGVSSWVEVGLPMLCALALFLCMGLVFVRYSRLTTRQEIDDLARIIERAAQTGDFHLQTTQKSGLLAPVALAFNRLMARLRGESNEGFPVQPDTTSKGESPQ